MVGLLIFHGCSVIIKLHITGLDIFQSNNIKKILLCCFLFQIHIPIFELSDGLISRPVYMKGA